MSRNPWRSGWICLVGLLVAAPAAAEGWDLSGVERIELEGVSGDVLLLPAESGEGRVELRSKVTRGTFEPDVEQDGSTLKIRENWGRGSSSGDVQWTIYLAGGGTDLRIRTSSGDLRAESIEARIELQTASGDIRLSNVDVGQGVSFSTASGDVQCEACRGHLRLSTASGDVRVKHSALDERAEFSSASGDVELFLDALPRQGLSASSASGDVLLESRDFGTGYTLVMTAREDKGSIVSPFRPTSERTFRRGGDMYEEQVVEQGSGGPEIRLSTASGSVVVRD